MLRTSIATLLFGLHVAAFIIAGTLLTLGSSLSVSQRWEIKTLRAEVEELKVLAKDQDATIQALAHEVEQLRGELKGAIERLEAAR